MDLFENPISPILLRHDVLYRLDLCEYNDVFTSRKFARETSRILPPTSGKLLSPIWTKILLDVVCDLPSLNF